MKKKRKVDAPVLIKRGLLCAIVLYMCILFISQQADLSRLAKEGERLDQQITQAEREHEELEAEKEASGTPEYIERVARDKLGYMKPEEKVFIDAKKQ